jgi:serine/threonine-protein kinase
MASEKEGAPPPDRDETRTTRTDEPVRVPDRRIGPYKVLRELGQGGMGTVYLAARADEQFHMRVALKVIRAGADSAAVVRHFKRERQILAGLDHPNIAKLLDGGTTDDGLPYFVMEYIEGEPLLAYCDSRALPIRERLRVFQAVCAAVEYAHRNLVVHRDIKPGNILVTAEGTPRLLDFGVAKLLNRGLAGEAPTATSIAMTPGYASPEQIQGGHITTASDVYSLGVVLYELLTGRKPYRVTSRQPLEVLRAISEQEAEKASAVVDRTEETPSPDGDRVVRLTPEAVAATREGTPEKLRRRLRGDLDNILMRALVKEPQRRFPSVEAFSDDVRRYLEGLPVKARTPTASYRVSKFVRRHAVGVAAAAAMTVLVVGFAVAMAVQSERVARERDVAERERETAQHVSAFMVDLFKVSDPGEARGNTITAREVLDKGAQKIATELKDQGEVRATLLDTMGNVYINLGLYDKATALLQDALQTRKEVLGSEHPEVANSLNNLANVLDDHGDYAGAEARHREALAMRRRLLGDDHPDVAKSLNNLAIVLNNKGDYRGAEAAHREALALKRRRLGNEHRDVANSLNNLANVFYKTGDFAASEATFREAVALERRLFGDEHPRVANSLGNLANVLMEKGDYTGAEALHREALALKRKLLESEHPDVAIGLASLADALWRQKKAAEAESVAREALVIFRKALPGDHPYIAETESVLGGALALSGRYEEAQALLLRSYPILKTSTGEGSPETRKTLERIVALYEAWGKPETAALHRMAFLASDAGKR